MPYLAADRKPGRVDWSFKWGRTVWPEVHRAIRDRTTFSIGYSHWEIKSVYKRDIIVVTAIVTTECPFSYGCRRYLREC